MCKLSFKEALLIMSKYFFVILAEIHGQATIIYATDCMYDS